MNDAVIFIVQPTGDGSYRLGTIPTGSLPSGVTSSANELGTFTSPNDLGNKISSEVQKLGQGGSGPSTAHA